MNKKLFFSITLILVLLSYIFNIDKKITQNLSILNTNIKSFYISNLLSAENFISQYFNQIDQITTLKYQLSQNEKYKVLYLQENYDEKIIKKNNLKIAQVVSYVEFNDFSKIILTSNFEIKNIAALITKDGYSAGIARIENSQIIGYLNHHVLCNYAIFIGENKIPGITHGIKSEKYIKIKFIPLWQSVKVGDEVVTSGMDSIFPKNIKVGKIIRVKQIASDSQEAIVEPYANVYNEDYFYIKETPSN